jgi:hypothetical protein
MAAPTHATTVSDLIFNYPSQTKVAASLGGASWQSQPKFVSKVTPNRGHRERPNAGQCFSYEQNSIQGKGNTQFDADWGDRPKAVSNVEVKPVAAPQAPPA